MKFALVIEYDGTDFSGWQRQSHVLTIQEVVEQAISQVADHEIGVACAGRTDTGVHALAQVVHFETNAERELRSWLLGINSNLPPSVVVKNIIPVAYDFHARFSAQARTYRYLVLNQAVRPALLAHRVTWERVHLEVERMHEAAQYLIGEHDFTSFRALACQAKHPVRQIHSLQVERQGSLIAMEVKANGFLHHMVRNLAGVLMSIGRGEHPVSWCKQVLDQKNRACAGITAPAQGLYFMAVEYDPKYQINEFGVL